MEYTPFAGLTALDENDPITIDGGSFGIKNPRITDQLLRVGAVVHRHDQHAALPNPHVAPTGAVIPSAGTIAASTTVAIGYTVLDKVGGETTVSTPLLLSTGTQIGIPTVAPTLTLVTSAGIMPAGNYYYALTYTDGEGGETTLGPQAHIYIRPGYGSASVVVSGLNAELQANGPVNWRLWRSYEGADWHLVTQNSTPSYDDGGFNPPDDPARPPLGNTTSATYSLAVTLPTAAQEPAIASGTAINLYLAGDTTFSDPCFYAQYPISEAGQTILITSETVTEGSPPKVSNSVPGANRIYPDTDMVWALKSPVARPQALGSGAYGDARIVLANQHVYGVLNPQGASIWSDWTDLTQVAAGGGITLMGSGVGDALWTTRFYENFQASGASAQISDFANASGATMIIASGLLTTSDRTQTDAVLGALTGPLSQNLPVQTWPTRQVPGGAVVPSVTGFAGWIGNNVPPNLSRPPSYSAVQDWATVGYPGGPPPGATPVPNYTDPAVGNHQLGDTLEITEHGTPDLLFCTQFWWDGTKWAPQYVDAVTGLGYSANNNWVAVALRRGAANHETIYGYQWTRPGQVPDGYKLRARFHGYQHAVMIGGEDGVDHPLVGLSFNLGDKTHGLTFYAGLNRSGWTTRPQDIILDQGNWVPKQYAYGPNGWDLDFANGQRYDKEKVPTGFMLGEDFWIEIWRIGNTAYAATYDQDPAQGAQPIITSTFDCTGTPYAKGNAGYVGVVANHIPDQQCGVVELTLQQSVVLPTITLYNESEIIISGSGGINVGLQRAGSGVGQYMISGGGIQLAGSGGAGGVTPYESYVEFAGSGGVGVAVQPLGGGSARVVIGIPPGGGGVGGGGLAEISGSGGVNAIMPVSDIEFAGSGGTGVAVQNLGGGSARVVISASGAQGPPGPAGIGGIEVAGSAGVGAFGLESYVEFAGSGGTGVAVQNLGGGSARVVIGAASGAGGGGGTTESSFSATQSTAGGGLAATTWTKCTLTQDYDDTGGFDAANSRFVAQVAGVYTFTAGVGLLTDGVTHAGDSAVCAIYKNGSRLKSLGTVPLMSNVFDYLISGAVTCKLAAGDVIELYAICSRAINISPTTNNVPGYLTGRLH